MDEDEIKVLVKSVGEKRGVDFVEGCMELVEIKVEVKGIENVGWDGLCRFVCNDGLGGEDGMGLGYILGKD